MLCGQFFFQCLQNMVKIGDCGFSRPTSVIFSWFLSEEIHDDR